MDDDGLESWNEKLCFSSADRWPHCPMTKSVKMHGRRHIHEWNEELKLLFFNAPQVVLQEL